MKITDLVGPDTPLRLDIAAKIAFPRGGMTAAGLRREHKRGRLVIERVSGKDYTTLNYIKEMRRLCRVLPDSGDEKSAETNSVESLTLPPGLSSMEVANSALDATLATLMVQTKPSPTTSTRSTSARRRRNRETPQPKT